jgi:AraC family transcriptional regulator
MSVIRPGETIIYDLKVAPTFHLNHTFHNVHYYVSRSALNAFAEEMGVPRVDELRYRAAVANDDAVIRNLSLGLLQFFDKPEEANPLLLDHVMYAVGLHAAKRYGGMLLKSERPSGGLASWQERRASEMIATDLTKAPTLDEIAFECGLSVRHFTRAFRQSVGMSPHQWLTEQRLDAAKRLLADDRVSLSEIASRCGFANQSHFSRVFTARIGIAPGAWRKSRT